MDLHATTIHKSLGEPPTRILRDITLDIQAGELVTLTGKSGSGKSTLLYILSTLDEPTTGDLEIGGRRVAEMSHQELHRFRNLHMGFIFQFHYLLPDLTALENVLMPARKTGQVLPRTKRAQDLLREVGLMDKASSYPRQLSGGEQQRVAIARALIMEPQILFADEPTGNLDSVNGNMIMQILFRINREQKMTVLYVTHDRDFASMAKRSITLVDGQIVG